MTINMGNGAIHPTWLIPYIMYYDTILHFINTIIAYLYQILIKLASYRIIIAPSHS